jgi:alpha-mannosidase
MSCGHNHGAQANNTSTGSYPVQNLSPGAKWIKGLTRGRLDQFNGGHYSDVNLGSALYIHRLDSEEFVKLQVWSAPGRSKPFFDEAMKQEYKKAKKGDSFGPSWVRLICSNLVWLFILTNF